MGMGNILIKTLVVNGILPSNILDGFNNLLQNCSLEGNASGLYYIYNIYIIKSIMNYFLKIS